MSSFSFCLDHKSCAETGQELMRPYLHEFLTSAYEDYDIVIWCMSPLDLLIYVWLFLYWGVYSVSKTKHQVHMWPLIVLIPSLCTDSQTFLFVACTSYTCIFSLKLLQVWSGLMPKWKWVFLLEIWTGLCSSLTALYHIFAKRWQC